MLLDGKYESNADNVYNKRSDFSKTDKLVRQPSLHGPNTGIKLPKHGNSPIGKSKIKVI